MTLDRRLSLEELAALPTLSTGQADDLKYDDGQTRVWLSRGGVADGEQWENTAAVEELQNGRWVTVLEYDAADVP
jgi:hypothetical protein